MSSLDTKGTSVPPQQPNLVPRNAIEQALMSVTAEKMQRLLGKGKY